ncbi:hypothetical protein B4U80_11758, partial [Leptotrombidium deliense]
MCSIAERVKNVFDCFPYTAHPELNVIEKLTNEWLEKNIIDEKLFTIFVKQRVSLISAFMFPWAASAKCVSVNKILILATIVDDLFEDSKTESRAKMLIHGFTDIVENDEIVVFSPDLWFEAALSNVWQDFVSESPVTWRKAFSKAISTLFASFVEESKIKTVPTMNEYFALRPISIAFNLPQLLIEYAKENYLTDYQRCNIAIQTIQTTANYIAVVLNDLYSFKREKMNEFNLIRVYMHRENMNEDEAKIKVMECLEEKFQLYLKQMQMQSLYPESIKWYLTYGNQLIRGSYDFYNVAP